MALKPRYPASVCVGKRHRRWLFQVLNGPPAVIQDIELHCGVTVKTYSKMDGVSNIGSKALKRARGTLHTTDVFEVKHSSENLRLLRRKQIPHQVL